MAAILSDDQLQTLAQQEAERQAHLQSAIAPPSAMPIAALPAAVTPPAAAKVPLIPAPTPVTPQAAGVTLPAVSPRVGADIAELDRLRSTGSGLDQFAARPGGLGHKLIAGLGRVADVIGSSVFPTVAMNVPGSSLRHQILLNRAEGNVTSDQAEEDAAAQAAQRAALAKKAESQGESFEPISLSPEQAAAIGHPELTGQDLSPRAYSMMLAGKQRGDVATTVAGTKAQSARDVADTKAQSAKEIETAREQSRKDIADAANKTRMLLEEKRAATSTANTNARIGAKEGKPGAMKVPADVTKRAALASNVLENADAVDEVIQRRPDIIGAAGGRYTNVQQLIGSDDPDIQALGVRIHNIALASNGAHGVRSFEAVRQTEDELFNHFKAGPHAIHGALQATRGSMQTFLDDERSFQTSGNRGGAPATPPGTGGGTGMAVSMTDARKLPAMKGKSDAEIRQAIQAAGHRVVD